MPTFKTITFVYRPHEDRVLAAINLGRLDAWSCWLTRRLSFAVLERAETFLAGTSLLAKRAGPTYQGELVAFEQAAAMEATAKAVSPTPRDILDTCAAAFLWPDVPPDARTGTPASTCGTEVLDEQRRRDRCSLEAQTLGSW
jgi:hypothetical protein